MTIKIRQATVDDYNGIEALLTAEFAPEPANLLTAGLQKKLQDNTHRSLVAVNEGKVIGHASINDLHTTRANFGSLAVASHYRQKGIASALTTARIKCLEQLRFQGVVSSNAVTQHPYSQQSLLHAGFSPVRVLLSRLPYKGIELETTIGFVRLFQLASEMTTIYLSQEYRDIASAVLSPFATVTYADSSSQNISERIQHISEEELAKPNSLLAVRLYEKTAPAEITYLKSKGFIVAGFYPVTIQDNTVLSAVVHMHRVPSQGLDKTNIKIAQPVEPLFDFVWQQYEAYNIIQGS